MILHIKHLLKTKASFLLPIVLIPEYIVDWWRYSRHSGMIRRPSSDSQLVGKIIQDYHVIEKGLTMPESRLGFGIDRITVLASNCCDYLNIHGSDNTQVRHAIAVILEYIDREKKNQRTIPATLHDLAAQLVSKNPTRASQQIKSGNSEYFNSINEPFPVFSQARKSVRNYSEKKIPLEDIRAAIDLARSAPSSCNKQGTRVHVYSDPGRIEELLAIQTGNRGFGHLTNKLIVVTGNLAFSHNVYERHQVYVDGGIFCMNLLYALHSKRIASCPLNCYLSRSKGREISKIGGIPQDEELVMMVSCGYPPDSFLIPLSVRNSVDEITVFHSE